MTPNGARNRLRLYDLHPGERRACVAGPHRSCSDEALLAAPDGWSEDVPFGLEEGLDLSDDARRGWAGRERAGPGGP